MAKKKRRVDAKNALVVERNEYVRVLNSIVAGGFCPFCEEHLFKHHLQPLAYKSQYWLVTKNSWPYKGSRFHFLFIARPHIETTEDISSAMWADLQKLYKKLIKENKIKGATLFIRSGDTHITGATVNHLHAHVVTGSLRTKNTKPIKTLIGFAK